VKVSGLGWPDAEEDSQNLSARHPLGPEILPKQKICQKILNKIVLSGIDMGALLVAMPLASAAAFLG
jgi:hypothetical protein